MSIVFSVARMHIHTSVVRMMNDENGSPNQKKSTHNNNFQHSSLQFLKSASQSILYTTICVNTVMDALVFDTSKQQASKEYGGILPFVSFSNWDGNAIAPLHGWVFLKDKTHTHRSTHILSLKRTL